MRRRAAIVLLSLAGACGQETVDERWHEGEGYRWRDLAIPRGGKPTGGFTRLAASATGVTHRNMVADDSALANRHLLIGAGAAVGDVDSDGLPDLFVASVQAPAVLYRNTGDFRFQDISATAGLDTRGLPSTSAAFADLSGDGHLDLVVGTLGGPLKLWIGDGKGRFTDVSATAGLADGYAATTMTIADVEGDGDLDLYVGTYKTRNGLDKYTPQQRAFDQVVKKIGGEYVVMDEWKAEYRLVDHPELGGIVRSQRAEPDLFFLNDGTGKFTRIAQRGARFLDEHGKPLREDPDYFTLASRFYDVNDDGAPDLYVCNDFEDPDQFWINDGKGAFRLLPSLALRETSNTCMSVDFGDINRDGHVDFFTADMMSPTLAQRKRQFPTHTPAPKLGGLPEDRHQWMRNMLQLSRGDGTWASIGDFAGVSATDWTWGSAFLDVDLDGREDLIALNGHRWDVRDADTFERLRNSFPRVPWNREQREFPISATRSFAFRNNGDLTFTDRSEAWGIGTESAISQGIALADFDGDGDQDMVATRLNDAPALFRNETNAGRIAVRLIGQGANRHGIGAKITVRPAAGDTLLPVQTREVTAGGYYLSGSDPMLSFASGPRPRDSEERAFPSIEVRWRSGRVSTIARAMPNRLYEVHESGAVAYPATLASKATPALFEDATPLLNGHAHSDSVFDDFRRQSLLPGRLSQLGPGITWADFDGDGRADLAVGAGRGGRVSVLRNRDGRSFSRLPIGTAVPGDVTTILPIPGARGLSLLAGMSNYEASSPAEALTIPRLVAFEHRTPARTQPVMPGDSASIGPMALGDVDGDGRLDLFVGARVVPGAWPLPASSRLYLGTADGGWQLDNVNARTVSGIGLVSAALFTDLDGDARPELVATAEWGPVRVFKNDAGRLRDVTREWGLSAASSRWNGLSAGDFDADGRLDLVVTSWGRNMPWKATPERPHVLIAGNFGREGIALVFARRDSASNREVPLESFVRFGIAVPSAREKIASFAEYSGADVDALLGSHSSSAVRVGATTFDHLVLLNRGGRFEARSLPAEAQLSPAFAPVVADFDGDGREDLFLAQNFSPTEVESPRLASGAGLLLRGDGSGGFLPLGVRESGIRVLGDQRGAAVSDFDGDGRLDLAVSQNGAATTLWRNRTGSPGLRVRLDGGPGNPFGVGAQMRVMSGQVAGPVREIRAGSAYWSVDDPVTVLARSRPDATLWIRWPDGVQQTVALAPSQKDVTVRKP